jgi:hypothetical protein
MLQGIIADEVMERVAKPLGLEHLPPFDAETADAVIKYMMPSREHAGVIVDTVWDCVTYGDCELQREDAINEVLALWK